MPVARRPIMITGMEPRKTTGTTTTTTTTTTRTTTRTSSVPTRPPIGRPVSPPLAVATAVALLACLVLHELRGLHLVLGLLAAALALTHAWSRRRWLLGIARKLARGRSGAASWSISPTPLRCSC